MANTDDMALVREYARRSSEPAFAELVRRHINVVYSVALRYVGNPHEAEDITQAVFIILARKADRLRDKTILTGWLYETTRFTSARFLRTKIRRHIHEHEAYMQSLDGSDREEVWRHLEPLLEEAMAQLGEKERTLLALRFFENKSGAEIAAALGLQEWAAYKRVSRAVEKLRKFFVRRGIAVSTDALLVSIGGNAVHAAPPALASKIITVAALKGAAVSGSTLTLTETTLKLMAWTKAKTVVAVGVVAILAATSTTVIGIKLSQAHHAGPRTSGLPVLLQKVTLDLQPDGTIDFQSTSEDLNYSGRRTRLDSFIISDFVHLERITDESGQPVPFTTRHEGDHFQYAVRLNQPVPPGGKIALTMEGTVTGVVRATAEPGVYEYEMHQEPGYVGDTRRVETHLLPAGALLLEKHPADLTEATNDGRIELSTDKTIPPGGSLKIAYRYRLPANAH